MSASKILAFALIPLFAIVACGSGDGRCLRASDCDDGYACIQGTCRTGERVDSPVSSSSNDASSTTSTDSASPTTTAPSSIDAATDTSTDANDAAHEAGDAAASDQ